ncbi:MAG: hypothetical protein Q4E35_10100 [Eubacteriales bacterium]|nr:hypothetical protein [Eubacteriales bacterium]
MKDNKTARLEMRIRLGDKEKITKAAKRSGVSVAEYVVGCCKKHPPKEKPPDEFWNLLGELYTVFDELSPESREKLAQLILRLQEAV